MKEKTYEDGLVEGKIEALEKMASTHTTRLDDHSGRLRILERAMWLVFGIAIVIQLWPAIASFLQSANGW